jgi:DNA polymerase III epsilon subunit-like protein
MAKRNYIFYDLETNGLDYYTTGILQMTMIDYNGNVLLNQYAYPFDNRIEGFDIHGIDENKLIQNKAISNIDLCALIKKIIREKHGRNDIYFIAYNNFGYDQIILENNFKKCNIKIPDNWYFIDMYPIIKEIYKNIKPNYKLMSVYQYLFGIDENINYHCALADTQCLYKIFKHIENEMEKRSIFIKYTRGLLSNEKILKSPLCTLNGYAESMFFEAKSIYNIGDLYKVLVLLNYNIDDFTDYLETCLGIYNRFYRINLVKQIDAIYQLQK